jgi:cell division protein FtsW (lipid II flippase)/cell division protein FtsI/penicillin-binding protein 2
MLLLAVLGTGPEGSGVKVNLFGFEVSELSKILMIIFFAAYFAVNADYFRNIKDNRWLTGNNLLMFALFISLLGIYAYLGDLGPAIVLCLTFLFFYAFAKEEFLQMILAAIVFGILLFATAKLNVRLESNYLPWVALAACAGTLIFAMVKRKQESVFFIVLIISSFVLLASLPFDFTQRLADRNSMFSNIWDNHLMGGDQVAHGVWALNSGGLAGQGLGRGFSNVMPAYHTDMIVESIGEEIGLLALIAIFIAFGLLVYRSILAARRTGKPFLFYLMAGIAIATMIQLSLIVAGTLGLIPLTGISVPFLSKGNAGIIITLFSFILIIILSNEKGDKLEMDYVKKNYDNVNAYAILSFFAVVLLFSGALLWYQFHSDKYIVKPALVLNAQGEYQYSYNPRIGILLKEIEAGTIYDRNGVLLATSDKTVLKNLRSKLIASGASTSYFDDLLVQEQKRYYPFASDLLFWLGDYNKGIAKEEASGYAAEYKNFTLLRGFDVKNISIVKTSDRYKENRFLPITEKENELILYDYSALAPFIKAGKNSFLIEEQNKKKKDIQLSLDVVLSQKLNAIIQGKEPYKKYRTSVVAVNAKTGDVLASASNPAPSYKDVRLIENIDPLEFSEIFRQLFNNKMVVPKDMGIAFNSRPGSTVKIINAFAAMNKYGLGATNFSYFIYPGEIIHEGEPVNEEVDMRKAIVRSSNVYFIKLVNEKNLQAPLFDLYDALGISINNRGGYHFSRPEDYHSDFYFRQWDKFLTIGKNIYNNKKLIGSKKRFHSHYSDIAWGQGELKATPLQMAKMSGAIANNGMLPASRYLLKAWNDTASREIKTVNISKQTGIAGTLALFMKEQSVKVSAATGLEVHGKTGSPERDKILKAGNKTVRKRVTDAWYTFFVQSPKLGAPIAFAIRIEEIGNSEFAKEMAIDILQQLKLVGYF